MCALSPLGHFEEFGCTYITVPNNITRYQYIKYNNNTLTGPPDEHIAACVFFFIFFYLFPSIYDMQSADNVSSGDRRCLSKHTTAAAAALYSRRVLLSYLSFKSSFRPKTQNVLFRIYHPSSITIWARIYAALLAAACRADVHALTV